MENIKIGVIMPHRNDRHLFLEQFHRIIAKQTLQPTLIEIVDYIPVSDEVDITPRYRLGYNNLRNKGLDIIAFMEVDDWYSNDYLEIMAKNWVKNNKPEMFGPNYTIYYNLRLKAHFTFNHTRRCSMMCTMMKPDMDIEWGPETNPFTDSYLWLHSKDRLTFAPEKIICLGIKHGIGKCGGRWHDEGLEKYCDNSINLKTIMDNEDYLFYSNLFPEVEETVTGRSKYSLLTKVFKG